MKRKLKKENIFIFINIIFLLGCCFYYGYRLLHYYRLENPKKEKLVTLLDNITADKNIVKTKEGLYKVNETYIYKGKDVDNYIEYSGRLFRIISINEDGYLKLITENSQTSMVWGYEQEYDKSYIKFWLNNSGEAYKSFINSLDNKDGLLVTNKTSKDVLKNGKAIYKELENDSAGLLSVYEYNVAGGKKSYLNNGEIFWTSNTDESNKIFYINDDGTISKTGVKHEILGVRPTITINATISNFKGEGTKENPYKIVYEQTKELKSKYVGEYIKYNNIIFRIIEKDTGYVKIVSANKIKNTELAFGSSSYFTADKDIGYYLNNKFYNSLELKNNILLGIFNTGKYDRTNKFDLNEAKEYTEKAYVGLLNIGELFINEDSNYFLGSRTLTSNKTVYEVQKNGFIYATSVNNKSGIRPTLYLKDNISIEKGEGTKKDPYIIE